MEAIVNSGRNFFAAKQAAQQPAVIDRFVLAFIPGQNPATQVNLGETMPTQSQIVGTFPISKKGYVNPNQVVYSLFMGPAIGPFTFNWVGLLADDNTLIAVSHVPAQQKFATVDNVLGNALTRSFFITYENVQTITGIAVEASSWQVDFTGRFDQQADLVRSLTNDFFGSQYFINDGFKIIRDAGQWKITPGVGYVGGIRVENKTLLNFDAGSLPADIYLDVYLDKNISSVDPVFTIAAFPAGTAYTNYTAPNGIKHFVAKISTLTTAAAYTDARKKSVVTDAGLMGGQQNDYANFLAAFGGKTDFVQLTANSQIERNSKNFTNNGLLHTLPDTSQTVDALIRLKPGDVMRFFKRCDDSANIQVKNEATDTIYVPNKGKPGGQSGTGITYDVNGELEILWTGTRFEAFF